VSRELARRLAETGIRDERVLWAVSQVPRHLFVPPSLKQEAEADRPLPIGCGQTISQPYIVAFMTEALGLAGSERILEIGTGSGYQTAILSLLAAEVYSVEIVPELSARAAALLLGTLGLENVHLKIGDGARGWPEQAPFDRILVTAAPEMLPTALAQQLAPGGRMIVPVGEQAEVQILKQVDRAADGALSVRDILPVRFVPLTRGEPLLH
jgi:protein-L-isoaspartate(D-aspartate) O-methyltransferase